MVDNIEKIIYINLPHRNDKKKLIEKELITYNLFNKTERLEGVIIQNNSGLGCSIAHLKALKHARDNNYKNCLILEDDFTFLIDEKRLESNLEEFFSLVSGDYIKYDVLMLSYNLQQKENTEYDFLLRVKEAQTASAYLVNSSYYDVLIRCYEKSVPMLYLTGKHWDYMNDQAWKPLQKKGNWYCFKEIIGKQRAGINDNGSVFVDYGC